MPDEMAVMMNFTTDRDHLLFPTLFGDAPKSTKGKAFCTLDAGDYNKKSPSPNAIFLRSIYQLITARLLQLATYGPK